MQISICIMVITLGGCICSLYDCLDLFLLLPRCGIIRPLSPAQFLHWPRHGFDLNNGILLISGISVLTPTHINTTMQNLFCLQHVMQKGNNYFRRNFNFKYFIKISPVIYFNNTIILYSKVICQVRNYFPSLRTLSSQVCIPLNKRLIYYDNDPAQRSLCGPIINSNDKLITSGSSRTFIILFITSILTRNVEQRGRANNS